MVTVPRVTGREVLPQPARPAYQSSAGATGFDAAGAGLQRAAGRLAEFGDNLARVAIREQEEDNARELKELDIAFAERVRLIGYGDGTEQNPGYYSTLGQTAIDRNQEVKKAIVEARREIAKRATNEAVVERFALASSVRINEEVGAVERHTAAQRRVASDTTSAARVNSAASDAAAAWNNPKIYERSRIIIHGEIVDMAERNGWAPEVAQFELRKAESAMAEQAIRAAQAVDPMEAYKLFQKYEGTMLPASATATRNLLQEGVLTVKTQELTDGLMAQAAANGWSQNQTLAKARAVLSGKEEDEVIQRLNARFSEQHNAAVRARSARDQAAQDEGREAGEKAPTAALTLARMFKTETEALDEAARKYEGVMLAEVNKEIRLRYAAETRTKNEQSRQARTDAWQAIDEGQSLAAWQRANIEQFGLLSAPDLDALQKYELRKAEGEPFAKTTDPDRWTELRRMDARTLSEINPTAERLNLNGTDWKTLLTMIEGAKKELDRNTDRQSTSITFGSTEISRLTAKRKMSAQERNEIENQMRSFIVSRQRQDPNNKPPSDEEITKEAAILLMKAEENTYVPFSESGTVARLRTRVASGDVTPAERANIIVPLDEIPQIILDEIKIKIEEAGKPYTDALAQELAGARAMDDRARFKRLLE